MMSYYKYMLAVREGRIKNEHSHLMLFEKWSEFDKEVEAKKRELILKMKKKSPSSPPKDWYVGITGQTKSKRLLGHKSNFQNLKGNTWCKVTTRTTAIAREVETRLKKMGYRTFTTYKTKNSNHQGNLSLHPKTVYAFIHS